MEISKINHSCFSVPLQDFQKAALVVFVDEDHRVKQLKSQYAYINVSTNTYSLPEFISEFWSPQFVSLEEQLLNSPGYAIHSVHLLMHNDEDGYEQYRLILRKTAL